ncbi:MAG: heavy-metal-associated domain-containing protein [Candidatus Dormibacteraeota bacterium]|nr:heavy-metal-associated domain-containing protein [Candidatus Dormibacteraeota bacterium]
MKKVLSVPEISCEHCERTIIGALQPLEGIRSVHVDVPAQHVSVEYDETRIGLERIKEVLLEEEYPVAAVSEQGR